MNNPIILASGSPRRAQLLSQVGIPHKIMVSNIDESAIPLEAAWFEDNDRGLDAVRAIAKAKVDAVAQALGAQARESTIIGADTLVYQNGKIFGKPNNQDEAYEMLSQLQGDSHKVYTGGVILRSGVYFQIGSVSTVTFRKLSSLEIMEYIETGEPMDKAGAYGIQELGASFVSHIDGDFYGIMGLPIAQVCRILGELGHVKFMGIR